MSSLRKRKRSSNNKDNEIEDNTMLLPVEMTPGNTKIEDETTANVGSDAYANSDSEKIANV